MGKSIEKYFLGLDIGTNSCGFAVADENYNILRVKGKKFWGVRLFDKADTAENRRIKRSLRRRLDRRKLKLSWLNEIFAKDIRLLYLALHSIIKRRGHFLYEGDLTENIGIANSINEFIRYANLLTLIDGFSFSEMKDDTEKNILKIIKDGFKKREAKNCLYSALNSNSKQEKALVDSLINGVFDVKKILGKEDEKIDFSSETAQEQILALEGFDEEEIILIEKAKDIYSLLQMKKILGEYEFVCESMVDLIEEHKSQLKEFKRFIKEFYPLKYNEVFRSEKVKFINYAHYINQTQYGGSKKVLSLELPSKEKRNRENFYKYIRGVLSAKTEKEAEEYLRKKEYFLDLIENGNFLLKPRSGNNSVLPNKLFEKELVQILKTNEQKYDFLKEIDVEYGITNSEK